MWRNWYTRNVEVVVLARECRFKSCHLHKLFELELSLMKKILIIIILIFLLLGGIFFAISLMNSQPTKQLTTTSGIMGKIQKGPGCGAIKAGESMDSCYSPIIARVVVKDSNNNEITHF